MKTALCLYGIVGSSEDKFGIGSQLDYRISLDYYKKNFLDVNNVDVYIHTWSIDQRRGLEGDYRPVLSLYEPQIHFNPDIRTNSIHSRWNSIQKVVQLKKQYEEHHNFTYDCVFVGRLDLALLSPIVLDKYDMNYFYASHWNDEEGKIRFLGKGFMDLWFFSNSKNMDSFGNLYDNINAYTNNAHIMSRERVVDVIGESKIRYTLRRFEDHDIVRRVLGCKK